jgi:SAM-dependent methyltransferase
MPTLPPQEPSPPQPELHQARQVAESFGTDAGRYDRARPPYPGALVERIIAASPGRDVLDVGTGTGIAARQFQAAGCTVLGVDPDARMAAFARQTGVQVEVATFEAWDPAGRAFDAVVAGQAWHWVDQAAGAAKAAQVLRPGGRLAVFGHVYETPPGVAGALAAALRRVAPDSPFSAQPPGPARTATEIYQVMFARAADGMRATAGLGEPEQWRFEWELSYTREQWLDLLPTTGMLTQLAPDQLAEVLASVGAAIDELGGAFTMPYATLAATAARTGAA